MSMTALRLATLLTKANVNCAIVGGAVRDAMYGATPKDFDIVTWGKGGTDTLIAFLMAQYRFQLTGDRLEDGEDNSSSTDGGDGQFTECWADWVKLANDDGVIIDVLQAKPDPQGIKFHTLSTKQLYRYRTVQVLKSFDVSMNQQALLIHSGEVVPILEDVPFCVQLRPLSSKREGRMRFKAAQYGLRYVTYVDEEGHF